MKLKLKVQEINVEKGMRYGMLMVYATNEQMVSNNRHVIVEKIDKEIRHDNMIKWQGKIDKIHLIKIPKFQANKRLITLTL
jgi:hypothetical protein